MTTQPHQKSAINKAEYKLLLQCAQNAIYNLEFMLANGEEWNEEIREFMIGRLEAWQTLKEKIEDKLQL